VRAITSRINNILKGYPGEASEKGGRLCIAVPAGEAACALFVLFSTCCSVRYHAVGVGVGACDFEYWQQWGT
jgi:hypothetical protein